ncbi:MAG: hypothetical protein ACOCVQ_01745 [Bacillota bacterium]
MVEIEGSFEPKTVGRSGCRCLSNPMDICEGGEVLARASYNGDVDGICGWHECGALEVFARNLQAKAAREPGLRPHSYPEPTHLSVDVAVVAMGVDKVSERGEKGNEKKRGRRGEFGVYELPPKPDDELPSREEEDPQYGWSDVVAFVIAAYQVIFPILGIMFGVFLVIWAILWLLAR